MKKIYYSFIFFFLLFAANAQQIDVNTAQKMAETFYLQQQKQKSVTSLQLYCTAPVHHQKSSKNANYYFIFNDGNQGFVIVSGDQRCEPILGYSTSGSFDTTDMPDNLRWWMQQYCDEMDSAFNSPQADMLPISNLWFTLMEGNPIHSQKATSEVQPLIKTKWGQGPPYNDSCPYDVNAGNDYNYRCVTGCVATAMAQILNYWKYPQKGTGSHSFYHSKYGYLYANFGSSNYDWNNMALSYNNTSTTAQKKAVARLMYHCGVSVDMNYGPDGSGIQDLNKSKNAFTQYFGYNATLYKREYYSNNQWISILKQELNAARPILYVGYDLSNGGHAFVCDGYDNYNYFHFNWGWNGNPDAYYSISALTPSGYKFNSDHLTIFASPKSNQSTTYDLRLYGNIRISSNPVTYNTAFWFSDSIANYSSSTFNGYVGVALYKQDGTYLGVYGTTTLNLAGGYYYPDLKCNITAQSGLTAGTYRVRFVYTTADDQYWHLIGDGNYTNDGYFTVSGGNATYDLHMYSPIHISSNPVPYNSAFYFTDSILNNGTKEYNGYIGVAIYKSDGTLVNIFGITQLDLESYYFYKNFKCDIPSQNGLPAGYYYARYAYLNSEDNYWYLIGNGDYYNYIDFTISGGMPSNPFTINVYSDNTNMGNVSGGCRVFTGTPPSPFGLTPIQDIILPAGMTVTAIIHVPFMCNPTHRSPPFLRLMPPNNTALQSFPSIQTWGL